MNARPDWLPELFRTDGEWEIVCASLYEVFIGDFIYGRPRFQTFPVWWNRKIEVGGHYEEGFWHLITKDDRRAGERRFDPRRAERLPWCGPSILRAEEPCYLVWDHKEGDGSIRTYIWYEQGDYLVVLQKRPHRLGQVAFLITAHYIEGDGRRRNLRRKYAKREA
jgi:hypothetical protein